MGMDVSREGDDGRHDGGGSSLTFEKSVPALLIHDVNDTSMTSSVSEISSSSSVSSESSCSSQDMSDLAEQLSCAARELSKQCGSLAAKNIILNRIPVTLNRIRETMEQGIPHGDMSGTPTKQVNTPAVEELVATDRSSDSFHSVHRACSAICHTPIQPLNFAAHGDEGTLCYEMCCAMSNNGATIRTKEDIVVWD
jgi:protein required for attachment to host cells